MVKYNLGLQGWVSGEEKAQSQGGKERFQSRRAHCKFLFCCEDCHLGLAGKFIEVLKGNLAFETVRERWITVTVMGY